MSRSGIFRFHYLYVCPSLSAAPSFPSEYRRRFALSASASIRKRSENVQKEFRKEFFVFLQRNLRYGYTRKTRVGAQGKQIVKLNVRYDDSDTLR